MYYIYNTLFELSFMFMLTPSLLLTPSMVLSLMFVRIVLIYNKMQLSTYKFIFSSKIIQVVVW